MREATCTPVRCELGILGADAGSASACWPNCDLTRFAESRVAEVFVDSDAATVFAERVVGTLYPTDDGQVVVKRWRSVDVIDVGSAKVRKRVRLGGLGANGKLGATQGGFAGIRDDETLVVAGGGLESVGLSLRFFRLDELPNAS